MPSAFRPTRDGALRAVLAWLYGIVPVALALAVYWPLREAWFFSDDLMHLAELEAEPLWLAVLRPFGGHNYLVRNLVFAGSWRLFGLQAAPYFWMVLATHALNTALLFSTLRYLLGSAALAAVGAAVWGTSPLAAGTLGWYSAYGHVLVALCLLLALHDLARRVATGLAVTHGVVVGWCLVLLAGTTCFGVGIGAALGFPVVAFLLLPSLWNEPRERRTLLWFPIATLAVYLAFRHGFPLLEALSAEESFHDKSLWLGFAPAPALLMHMLRFAATGTVLGFFNPVAYPDPLATGATIGWVLGCGFVARWGEPGAKRTALAMGVLAFSTYAVIVVGRAGVYSMFKVPPWAAAAVPRYHYAATIPIVVIATIVLQQLARRTRWPASAESLMLAAGFAIILGGWAQAGSPITNLYGATRDYFAKTAFEIARAVRSAPASPIVYLPNGVSPPVLLGSTLPNRSFPGRAAVFLLTQRDDRFEGRVVRFVEPDQRVLDEYRARPRNRLRELLVAPGEVPAGAATPGR